MREDNRFIASHARFDRWASGRKTYRMEFFYREMRRETGILMDGADPVGSQWNLDAENRRALPSRLPIPARSRPAPDVITREVIDLVAEWFPHGFGDLEPFGWAVTRDEALVVLDEFLMTCLPSFGDYQDAMRHGAPFLFHSTISPYLNVGLLLPREVCDAAEAEFRVGRAPLNAVEGSCGRCLVGASTFAGCTGTSARNTRSQTHLVHHARYRLSIGRRRPRCDASRIPWIRCVAMPMRTTSSD